LYGGWSSEREISINSGKSVAKALKAAGHEVVEINVTKNLRDLTDALYAANPDYVFNTLHGTGGEDGVVQGVLEVFGKPYNGCGVLASAIAFDKAFCKAIVAQAGVRVPQGILISKSELKSLRFPMPFVAKPAAEGSSVGVFIINTPEELKVLQSMDWSFGERIIVEEFVPGREFTVFVLNNKSIGAVEICPKHKFYDFSSKYDPDGSRHIGAYDLPKDAEEEMFSMAEKATRACNCKGGVRVDFRFNDRMYFLEINTLPGMTETSLVPDIARNAGIPMTELLRQIMEG
jgi:D-alanine-D-alanine ligase